MGKMAEGSMDFETGKARIMDALLAHGGLRHLVDVGADVLGNPIFVCDLAAQVMAMITAAICGRI